jgi:hypothetical protein
MKMEVDTGVMWLQAIPWNYSKLKNNEVFFPRDSREYNLACTFSFILKLLEL